MTRAEFRTVEAMIAAYWPMHPVPDAAADAWHDLLAGQDIQTTLIAIKSLYVDGRDFPPNAGQILKRITDADSPAEWDDVLAEIRQMLRSLNRDRRYDSGPAGQIWHTPAPTEWSCLEIADLIERSGGIRAWAEALGSWWPGCQDDTTFLAQQRNVWNAMRSRSVERGRMAAIGAGNQDLPGGQLVHIGDAITGIYAPAGFAGPAKTRALPNQRKGTTTNEN